MVKRSIAAVLGIGAAINGVLMLADGLGWYEATPGVAGTGPFNPHFVADIGVAYLVAGLALAARGWRPRYWPAALAGAAFFAGHGVIHVLDIIAGRTHHAGIELALIVIPAALAVYAAFPAKGEIHA